MAAAQLAEQVRLQKFMNIAMSEPNGALVKTSGGGGYNATATSPDFISSADSKRRGISCIISHSFADAWMIGLVSAPSGQQQQEAIAQRVDCACLTYAARVGWGRGFYVDESGKECGHFGSVQMGDYIEIVVNSEKPPSIEYCINGSLLYKSKTPIVFPLFPKICAYKEGPLAEDLRWIVEPPVQVTDLQAHIAELQTQLCKREEEKQDMRTSIERKQAEIEVLLAALEQQKKEMKAGSDALVAITKEKAELRVQLESAREASQVASEAKVHPQQEPEGAKKVFSTGEDEKLELRTRNLLLQREVQSLHKAIGVLTDAKVQLQVEKKEMHAEMQGLRRQLLRSDEASSEASSWEDVSSSVAVQTLDRQQSVTSTGAQVP